jgi:hypothetical protein
MSMKQVREWGDWGGHTKLVVSVHFDCLSYLHNLRPWLSVLGTLVQHLFNSFSRLIHDFFTLTINLRLCVSLFSLLDSPALHFGERPS